MNKNDIQKTSSTKTTTTTTAAVATASSSIIGITVIVSSSSQYPLRDTHRPTALYDNYVSFNT